MRRLAAAVLVLIVVIPGCTDSADSVRTPEPDPERVDGIPPMLVARGRLVQRWEDGKLETLTELETGGVALVVPDPRGGVLFQRQEASENSIMRLANGKRSIVKTNAALQDAATIHGAASMIYATCVRRRAQEPEGFVYVMDLETRVSRRITESCLVEFAVTRVSVRSNVVVTTAMSDLTEVFDFFRADGSELTRPNPTDDLAYNEPPRLLEAVLSPDAKKLAYLEGPDASGRTGDGGTMIGDWAFVVRDQDTGREVVRAKLAAPSDEIGFVRLDFDGRWAVVSQFKERPVRVIDTATDDPRELELQDVEGIASFVED